MRIHRIVVAALLSSLLLGSASASAYTIELTPTDEEHTRQAAKEAVEQREREIAQASAQKAAEEKAQAEASERPERERAEVEANLRRDNETGERQQAEREVRERKARLTACHVPALRGHSIQGARELLHRADCALGALRVRRAGHGSLVVVEQSVAAGARRPAGTHVAIVLAHRGG